MPGFTITIKDARQHFLCILCHLLLREPVQTVCGHRCCLSCVEKKRGFSSSFICPEDGTEVTEDHRAECEYISLSCTNQDCDAVVPKKLLPQHLKTECLYRLEPCELCGERIVFAATKKHYQTTCPQVKIKCSQCGKDIFRGQLTIHQESDCDEAVFACPFIKVGCTSRQPLKKNERCKHMEKTQSNHITYLLNYTLGVARSMEEMQHGFNAQLQAVLQMTALTKTHREQDLSLKAQAPANGRGRVLADSIPEERSISRQPYSSLPTNLLIAGQHANLHDLNSKVEVLEGQITALNLQFTDHLASEVHKLVRSIDAARDLIRKLEQKCINMEDLQRKTAINMVEQNDRIEYLENSTFNGTLIWPIKDFMKKRRDSIVGRNVSLFSPHFFTSRNGYKMRLRIYLNGDGVGKGSHVSLFFVICKGKFDALLPWPFKQKVTMSIIDQNFVKDVTDAFKPDPVSSSFQRPVKETNIASGCPLFMKLSMLDLPGYVKDDTLFVKVQVDLSNLP